MISPTRRNYLLVLLVPGTSLVIAAVLAITHASDHAWALLATLLVGYIIGYALRQYQEAS